MSSGHALARQVRSDYTVALGARLRAARETAGLTQGDVQRKSGGRWKQVVIGSWERADRRISPEHLVELAEFYGQPAGLLLTGRHDTDEAVIAAAVAKAIAAERERIVAGLYGGQS